MSQPCDGNGLCIPAMPQACEACLDCKCDDECDCTGEYLLDPNCLFKCETVPCPNFEVCGNRHPQYLMNCWRGRCSTCDMALGKHTLVIDDDPSDCCVCYETKRLVTFPGCLRAHKMCGACFNRIVLLADGKDDLGKCPQCRGDLPEPDWKRPKSR